MKFNLFPIKEHLSKHPKDIRKATMITFVTNGDSIIAVGYNRRKFPYDGRFTYHSEEAALKIAGRRAKGSTVYVIRIKKNGSLGYAKPCDFCRKYIEKYGVAKVYYSMNNEVNLMRLN